jgi:hypothetical protein
VRGLVKTWGLQTVKDVEGFCKMLVPPVRRV